ncbi:MAG: DnaJ C-terminal domain-containing protein, partial [Rectinemataceae bacterium]|nr:DnaJ C-terminal domain-containing protein [Rectinemataceae bacterium]
GAKPGTELETCKTCNGQGKMHETRNSPLGAFTSVRTCAVCEGSGKLPKEKCSTCSGHGVERREEEIQIQIPKGIDGGEMIRMPGQGEAIKGGTSGDLYVKVHVKPHAVFKKEGMNLVMNMPMKLTDALLGTTATITTVDEKKLEVTIPAMAEAQQTLRLKGKGVVIDGHEGDLLIRLTATLPKKISGKAKKAIEELKSEGL